MLNVLCVCVIINIYLLLTLTCNGSRLASTW